MPFRRRPQNLVGIPLATYWTALADDPLSALLVTAGDNPARLTLVELEHESTWHEVE